MLGKVALHNKFSYPSKCCQHIWTLLKVGLYTCLNQLKQCYGDGPIKCIGSYIVFKLDRVGPVKTDPPTTSSTPLLIFFFKS